MGVVEKSGVFPASKTTEVWGVLAAMQGELDASMNPHRLALAYLGMDANGHVQRVYCDEAFNAWNSLLRRQPDDAATIHHLAIMHHARAVDAEAGESPEKADPDWEAAMGYWRRLYKHDGFWEQLAEALVKRSFKREASDTLRVRLPELLLQVHYDVAFAPSTKLSRAKYHIKLALDSSFPKESKMMVRRETYTRAIRSVDAAVWLPDMLEPTKIKEGTDAIELHLKRDPGCRAALEDALRLQVRLLRARVQELHTLETDSPQGEPLQRKVMEDAAYWKTYFEQLIRESAELDDEIRQKLCFWCQQNGIFAFNLTLHEQAVWFFEQGAVAGREDDDMRKSCLSMIPLTHAHQALARVRRGDVNARAACDRTRIMDGLTAIAHRVLALAYAELRDFDAAEAVCQAGMQVEPPPDDYEAMEELEQVREQLSSLLVNIGEARQQRAVHENIEEAKAFINQRQFELAIRALDRVLSLDVGHLVANFFRAQCHLETGNLAQAARDASAAKQACGPEEPAQVVQAVSQLEGGIRARLAEVSKFGPEGGRLRSEAGDAFNAKQFAEAAEKLRLALAQCPSAGQREIGAELSVVLSAWAVSDVNAVSNARGTRTDYLEACRQAMARLQDAARFDPDSARVREHINTLEGIMKQNQANT